MDKWYVFFSIYNLSFISFHSFLNAFFLDFISIFLFDKYNKRFSYHIDDINFSLSLCFFFTFIHSYTILVQNVQVYKWNKCLSFFLALLLHFIQFYFISWSLIRVLIYFLFFLPMEIVHRFHVRSDYDDENKMKRNETNDNHFHFRFVFVSNILSFELA